MFSNGYRAGERDLFDRRLGHQVLGHFSRNAEYEIKHASRQTGIGETLDHLDTGAGRLLRSLDDDRAASRQGPADFARRSHHRKIPRRERRDNPDRFMKNKLTRTPDAARDNAAVRSPAFLRIPAKN